MLTLEAGRGRGRNDYPVRAVWNWLLAGIVFGHESIESLRREWSRNAQLRPLCGFEPLLGADGVPPPWVYSRFFKVLFKHKALMEEMVEEPVAALGRELPGFGKVLAMDTKALRTTARGCKKGQEPTRSCASSR